MLLDVPLADLGDQPRLSEGVHGRRARFHQSWYRAAHLGVKGWGYAPSGRAIGSILPPAAAEAGLNFVAREARELFLTRRQQGWGVDPVRMTRYMTSSQALLVNLLGPLGSNPTWLLEVLRSVLERPDVSDLIRWDIEFAPPTRSQYLGDMTRLDAFFRMHTDAGVEGVVLELKYTDRFSSRKLDLAGNPKYAELASTRGLWHEPRTAFLDPVIGQLLRCHALGERILEVDEPATGATTLLLVSHPNDPAAPTVIDHYRAHLTDASRAVHVGLDRLLTTALSNSPNTAAAAVVRDLQLRYLDHQQSDALWDEYLAESATSRSRARIAAE